MLGTLHVLSHIIFQVIMEYLCYMKPKKLKLRRFGDLIMCFILFYFGHVGSITHSQLRAARERSELSRLHAAAPCAQLSPRGAPARSRCPERPPVEPAPSPLSAAASSRRPAPALSLPLKRTFRRSLALPRDPPSSALLPAPLRSNFGGRAPPAPARL